MVDSPSLSDRGGDTSNKQRLVFYWGQGKFNKEVEALSVKA